MMKYITRKVWLPKDQNGHFLRTVFRGFVLCWGLPITCWLMGRSEGTGVAGGETRGARALKQTWGNTGPRADYQPI